MECPQCHATNPPDQTVCQTCGRRLFAWLGDPFGVMERPAATAGALASETTAAVAVVPPPAEAVAAPPPVEPRLGGGFPWGKAATATVFVLVVFLLSPGWALLLAVAFALLLWRWPRLGAVAFAGCLAGLLVTSWMIQLTVLDPQQRSAEATRVAPTHAAEATRLASTRAAEASRSAVSLTADGYNSSGFAKWRARDYEGAVQDFTRAIELAPLAPSHYRYRALTLVSLGRYELALQDAEQAVRLNSNELSLTTRAYVYLKLGRYREALADYEEASRLEDPRTRTTLGHGLALAYLGDRARAIPMLEKGIREAEREPSDPQLDDLLAEARRVLPTLRAAGARTPTNS